MDKVTATNDARFRRIDEYGNIKTDFIVNMTVQKMIPHSHKSSIQICISIASEYESMMIKAQTSNCDIYLFR